MWLPEVPNKPGLYASKREGDSSRKNTKVAFMVTADIDRALQFEDKAECEKWCKDNPAPPFKAVEVK